MPAQLQLQTALLEMLVSPGFVQEIVLANEQNGKQISQKFRSKPAMCDMNLRSCFAIDSAASQSNTKQHSVYMTWNLIKIEWEVSPGSVHMT